MKITIIGGSHGTGAQLAAAALAAGDWLAVEQGDRGRLRGTIARHDLAGYLLQVLGDRSTQGKAISVSNR